MKKLLFKSVAVLIALTFVFSFTVENDNNVYAKKKKIVMYALPSINNIKIKVMEGKNASYYKIYKATFSKKYAENKLPDIYRIPKKKYKFLKKTSKKVYVDKKVKKNNYYCYIVKGFNKKGKCIEKYDERCYSYCLRRIGKLDTPNLFCDSYDSEGIASGVCSSKKLEMVCDSDCYGPCATGFILYRKEEGKKEFKKLYKKKYDFGSSYGGNYGWIKDKTVKAYHKYSYKIKYYIKTKKKTYYSKMSNDIKLWAVNSSPNLKIKSMTDPFIWDLKVNPLGKHDFVIKLSDSEGDGTTKIYSGGGHYSINDRGAYYVCKEYSFNNNDWNTFPDKGIYLPKKKPIYLKCEFIREEYYYGDIDYVIFDPTDKSTYMSYTSFYYEGPTGLYGDEAQFLLGKGTGSVYEVTAD